MHLLVETWWPYIVMAVIGILINILFIRATTKAQAKHVLSDTCVTVECVIVTINGVQLLVRCIMNENKDVVTEYLMEIILDAVEFMLDGSYVWILLIIDVGCCRVLKRIQHSQNHDVGLTKVHKGVLVTLVLSLMVFSSTYGVLIYYSKVNQSQIIKPLMQIFHAFGKIIPLSGVTFLHIFILAKSFLFMSTKRQTNEEIYRYLYQNIFYLTFSQMVTFVLPGLFVYGLELLEFNIIAYNEQLASLRITYCIIKHLLVIFNPVSFGMLLSPRRYLVFSCLKCDDMVEAPVESTEVTSTNNAIRKSKTDESQYTVEKTTGRNICDSTNKYVCFPQCSPSTETTMFFSPILISSNEDAEDSADLFTANIVLQNFTADQMLPKTIYSDMLQEGSERKASTGNYGHTVESTPKLSMISPSYTPFSLMTDVDEPEHFDLMSPNNS